MECVPKTVECPICGEVMECTSPGRLYQCTDEECGWELAWGPKAEDRCLQLAREDLKEFKFKILTLNGHVFPVWMSPDHVVAIGFRNDLCLWLEQQNSIKVILDHWGYPGFRYSPTLCQNTLDLFKLLEDFFEVHSGLGGVLLLVGDNFMVAMAPRLVE